VSRPTRGADVAGTRVTRDQVVRTAIRLLDEARPEGLTLRQVGGEASPPGPRPAVVGVAPRAGPGPPQRPARPPRRRPGRRGQPTDRDLPPAHRAAGRGAGRRPPPAARHR